MLGEPWCGGGQRAWGGEVVVGEEDAREGLLEEEGVPRVGWGGWVSITVRYCNMASFFFIIFSFFFLF